MPTPMIRAANAADYTALLQLWQICFGDPSEWIEFFLTRMGRDVSVRVAEENGQIVAAAYLVDAQLNLDQPVPIWYEYALGTRPEARGRGVMATLLQQVRAEANARGIPYTALVPADAHLAAYYEKQGYMPFFTVRTVSHSRAEMEAVAAYSKGVGTAAQSALLRTEMMRSCYGAVQWSRDAVRFAFDFAKKCGAKTVHVPNGYAVWYEENNTARITEWICTPDAFAFLSGAFLSRCACGQIDFRLPGSSPLFVGEGKIQPFGMLRSTGSQPLPRATNAYLGLEMN